MIRRKRPRTLPVGVYTDGICKAEDRIDSLLPELQRLHLSKADRVMVRKLAAEYRRDWLTEPDTDDGLAEGPDLDDLLDELVQVAENYLPEFCLLGNLEGDGACFGVWVDVEQAQQAVAEGEVWADHDRQVPVADRSWAYESQSGYAKFHGDRAIDSTWREYVPKGDLYLVISDHGNVSLYRSLGKGKSREIWGVV